MIPLSPRMRWNAFHPNHQLIPSNTAGESVDGEIDRRLAHRLGVEDMDDALVDRDARAEREDEQRDDERPEVDLAALAERMSPVGRLAGAMLP